MLQLRPLAKCFLRCSLGDGRNCSFWFNHWSTLGQLWNVLGEEGPRPMGIPMNSKVSEATSGNGWFLPGHRTRNKKLKEVQTMLLMTSPPDDSKGEDSYYWQTGHSALLPFSNSATWDCLRPSRPRVQWEKVVWFKGHVPKHVFTFWVWNRVLLRLGHSTNTLLGWSSLNSWLSSSSSKAPEILKRLVAQAAIFFLWRERNTRLHMGTASTPDRIFKAIDQAIRDILLARYRRKPSALVSIWFTFS
ncbi:unnamed protein product [Arabis nemorensis]|uniref:Reverse transcriptase zinc-binding domain-containing protein n=1 Tax=Arabis nemorensis TaxID=586526 RepID=A0A565AUZ4_9BRAS|nr:unnamed protein product [Arabis nemorensis]